MRKIVVLGGGLAGLSTLWHLDRAGYRDYCLYEKESRLGGLTRSEKSDGFTFDYTGHLLHFRNPYVKDLVQSLLGENLHFLERNSWVFANGVYTHYPFQTNIYGLPPEVIKECIQGFVEAKYEGKTGQPGGKSASGETFEDWIYSNFGWGIAKHFMVPYNEKIWTISPREMTCDWMGRFVPNTSLAEILEGAVADQSKKVGYNAHFYYPLKGGIESLPRAFARNLQNLHTGFEVKEIDLNTKSVAFSNGERTNFDELVSTIPLPLLIRMIKQTPERIRRAASSLKHNSVLNVNLGVDRILSDKHWIYFPEPEYVFYRVGFMSNFSPHMAPPGTSSLYAEVSYSQSKPIDKARTVERVKEDLIRAGILERSDHILAEKCLDIHCAYVLYDQQHRANTQVLKDFAVEQGIHTLGRYGCWEYSGMEDAIYQGQQLAERLIASMEVKEQLPLRASREVSILVPIYNEEKILEQAVQEIVASVSPTGVDYELLLCENGSKDRTREIAQQLVRRFRQVRLISYPQPNYGRALQQGILEAKGRHVVCFEIDFWDGSFVEIAKVLLGKYDAVVGSKRAKGSRDRRPLIRRLITYGFNLLLRLSFGFQGTDTHGIKAFRRLDVLPLVKECQTDKDIFVTELILRMERAGLYMCEIPLEIEEKRPAPINLIQRVPSAIRNILRLRKVVRHLPKPAQAMPSSIELAPKSSASS